jgi:hypothetical protein
MMAFEMALNDALGSASGEELIERLERGELSLSALVRSLDIKVADG